MTMLRLPGPSRPALRFAVPFGVLALALSLAACDSGPTDPTALVFGGLTYTAVGGATLGTSADGLVVGGPGAGEYGVRVDVGAFTEADFRALPVALPATSRWGVQLFGPVGGTRTAVATAWAEALDADTHALVFDFDASTGATTFTAEYYLGGQLLYRVPGLPLDDGLGRLRARTVGEGDDEPESVHVIRDGTRYIVATDYGGNAPRTTPGGCAGILLRVDFPDLPQIPEVICTDYVQAIPDRFDNVEAVESLEIRARALDAFTLTRGTVE